MGLKAVLMEPGNTIWDKAFRNQVGNFCRLDSQPQHLLQNRIIPGQHGHDFSSVGPAVFCHLIIVTVLALLTAELLVRPAILDLISTLKTHRHFLHFLRIFHKAPI